MFHHAIVRLPGSNFAQGLTRVDLGAPDAALALRQHHAYCEALRECGLEVATLPVDPRYPDGTFVEDTAIVLPEGAIITRPGAASRLGEVDAIRGALSSHFPALDEIETPGTVDGGDICEADEDVFIGISARTNDAGAQQLSTWLRGHGYRPHTVDIRGMDSILHLKSGIAALDGHLLLIEELADHPVFAGRARIVLDADEAYGANAVQVNDRVLVAQGHPKLEAALRAEGYEPLALDMSEYAKMDGGLSCLSLRF